MSLKEIVENWAYPFVGRRQSTSCSRHIAGISVLTCHPCKPLGQLHCSACELSNCPWPSVYTATPHGRRDMLDQEQSKVSFTGLSKTTSTCSRAGERWARCLGRAISSYMVTRRLSIYHDHGYLVLALHKNGTRKNETGDKEDYIPADFESIGNLHR